MTHHNERVRAMRTLTAKYYHAGKLFADAAQKINGASAELETVSPLPAAVSPAAAKAASEMMADLKDLEAAFRRLRAAVVRGVPEPGTARAIALDNGPGKA